jgi:hypothetical protein
VLTLKPTDFSVSKGQLIFISRYITTMNDELDVIDDALETKEGEDNEDEDDMPEIENMDDKDDA